MQIIHILNPFFYTIFPELQGKSIEDLIEALKIYYKYGPYKPKVTINDKLVYIEIDKEIIKAQEAEYRKVLALCDKRNYTEAKHILRQLIEKNPSVSEYHRVMGQILSDEGNQDEAINCLIDALRWDSKNGWALLMMGNIFAKFKDDIPTAMKYFDQALIANPNDNITINNIGANLMQQGKLEEAKKYFWEAIKINDTYPNTHFALGMISEIEADLHSAFYSTIQAIKYNKNKDVLYKNSVRQAFEIAQKVIATDTGQKIYREYRSKLEFEGDRKIDILKDEDIPTAAKFEFAENYDRDIHIVRFKPNYPAHEHLIMHELVHLDFVIAARKDNLNQIFISNQEHKSLFIKELEPTIKKFSKMGISEKAIADYCSSLFAGVNRQVYNAPIDLFIENFLYHEFSDLRPYQFISLYTLVQEALKTVTDKKIIEMSPKDIISKSKVYNIVSAMQFKELYGFDFIQDFNATNSELKQAKEFYDEYLQYKDDKVPAEEYELVIHWAEDLALDKYFELVDENHFRNKRTDIDHLLTSIENDPYDLESKDKEKEKEMERFTKAHENSDTNMSVVMYMVDALQFFKDIPIDQIKGIAMEIATQGTLGFSPEKQNYRVSQIPGKLFSGYQILAYYYVSWTIAMPDAVGMLGLNFGREYEIAKNMTNLK